MVTHRSNVDNTQAARQGGWRRGTAAAALGVVLAFSAGAPAAQSTTGVSPLAPGPAGTDVLALDFDGGAGGLLGPLKRPTPSPSPSSSSPRPTPSEDPDEPEPGRSPRPSPTWPASPQPVVPPVSLTPQPAAPQPVLPVAPQPARPALAPPAPPAAAAPAAEAPPGTEAAASPSNTPTTSPTASGVPASAPALPRSGSTSMEATSTRQPINEAPLLGLGIGLVVLSLIAGVVVLRIRRV
ncbi:MAG TPA: hypothetical protein VLT34_15050 [Arthrobacter sp.]|nr:hypothetical protein [Arthrobacter sp.]